MQPEIQLDLDESQSARPRQKQQQAGLNNLAALTGNWTWWRRLLAPSDDSLILPSGSVFFLFWFFSRQPIQWQPQSAAGRRLTPDAKTALIVSWICIEELVVCVCVCEWDTVEGKGQPPYRQVDDLSGVCIYKVKSSILFVWKSMKKQYFCPPKSCFLPSCHADAAAKFAKGHTGRHTNIVIPWKQKQKKISSKPPSRLHFLFNRPENIFFRLSVVVHQGKICLRAVTSFLLQQGINFMLVKHM